jgi:branched-chain amino acid transport system ATP-binding protein
LDPEQNAAPNGEILKLEGLKKNFGGLWAVSDFSLSLSKGELKGLIGPNGAGKSTVFNLISGLYKPAGGRVFYDGQEITGLKPDKVAKLRLARTFQGVKLLENQTVMQMMMTAFFLFYRYTLLDTVLQSGRYRRQEQEFEHRAMEYLALLGVDHLRNHTGGELSYGLQRKVSIARALCLKPKIILLDEPMAGLNAQEKHDLIEIIRRIKDRFGLSIILVEHDIKVIMNLCGNISVMNQGRLIAEGTAEEIRQNPLVVEAYLGASTHE